MVRPPEPIRGLDHLGAQAPYLLRSPAAVERMRRVLRDLESRRALGDSQARPGGPGAQGGAGMSPGARASAGHARTGAARTTREESDPAAHPGARAPGHRRWGAPPWLHRHAGAIARGRVHALWDPVDRLPRPARRTLAPDCPLEQRAPRPSHRPRRRVLRTAMISRMISTRSSSPASATSSHGGGTMSGRRQGSWADGSTRRWTTVLARAAWPTATIPGPPLSRRAPRGAGR